MGNVLLFLAIYAAVGAVVYMGLSGSSYEQPRWLFWLMVAVWFISIPALGVISLFRSEDEGL